MRGGVQGHRRAARYENPGGSEGAGESVTVLHLPSPLVLPNGSNPRLRRSRLSASSSLGIFSNGADGGNRRWYSTRSSRVFSRRICTTVGATKGSPSGGDRKSTRLNSSHQ